MQTIGSDVRARLLATLLLLALLPGCGTISLAEERRLGQPRETRSEFPGQLLSIEKVVDPEPVLSGAMLSILRETARRVLCPIGIAVAAALPPGSAPRGASEAGVVAHQRRSAACAVVAAARAAPGTRSCAECGRGRAGVGRAHGER